MDSAKFRNGLNIYALYDSVKGIAFDDLKEAVISNKYNVTFIDCRSDSLPDIIDKYCIGRFFVPCIQLLKDIKGLSDLKCEVIFVSHDLAHEELYNDYVRLYMDILKNPGWQLKRIIHNLIDCIWELFPWVDAIGPNRRHMSWKEFIKPAVELYQRNPKTTIITVSEYSRNSLHYYYSINPKDIQILYSPQRVFANITQEISDRTLSDLISRGVKYYLMVSANRTEKNPNKALNAFKQFAISHPDSFLVTVGYTGMPQFANHIPLPFLSDSDLSQAYSNCYALIFPSFFEGFGYPPVEAMKYAKPILASYSTSIPEILGDAAIYFCPFYESGIFNALEKLDSTNYDYYSDLSRKKYLEVNERQEKDLATLINIILAGTEDELPNIES